MSEYPKVNHTKKGWVVSPNSRSNLPGVYLTKLAALKALRSYEILAEEFKNKRSKKKTVEEKEDA